ncbi:hypothetical protein HYN59_13565 [Flavobacterium album]|uniref:Ig-like domain-containing protein n=1 Tax=Flavobacterium album TaxID=2175091 RepID=A0A2S1R0C1_9FLAO|nr:hypothetical protein [Flavobacterium album]AWH86076.1 hypothetical protein HYN59_13565 [Flavobacterium album]
MKKIIFILFLFLGLCATAQVKVGDNPTAVNASAVLETESTTKGFLPPRMTTAQRDAISNPAKGLMIYNTETNCTETFLGIGVSGTGTTGWKNLCKANINATFTASTLNCAVTNSLKGDYVATVAMTEANYKIVTVTTLSAGDYTASSNELNGVKFAAEGTISSVGAGTQLKLMASGSPTAVGTFTYTVTLSGQTCTFDVTYANPPAPLQDNQTNCSGSAAGRYVTNNSTTSAEKIDITVTPTGIGYYSYTAGPVNGITFSANGTFVAGDVNNVKTITLTASGTPLAAGTFTYTVTGTNVTSSCSFSVTVTAEKQFLSATTNTLTITSTNNYFTYSNVTASAGGISISGSNITLKAGKTYYLEASLRALAPNGGYVAFEFVNASNNRLAGTSRGIAASNQSSTPAAGFYTVGTSDEIVSLKVVAFNGVAVYSDSNGGGSLIIKEVGSSRGYLSALAGSSSQNLFTASDFLWGTAVSSNAGVSVSGSSITLKANKTYRLFAAIRAYGAVSNFSNFYFANASNTKLTGTSTGIIIVPYTSQSCTPATGIYTVGASDEIIKLRIAPGSGSLTSANDANGNCVLIVEEITGASYLTSTLVDQQNTSSVNANLNYNTPTSSTGGLSISGQNITLKAGKVYRIAQHVRLGGSTTNPFIGFTFANSANTNLSGINIGGCYGQDHNQSSTPSCGFYRVGSSDETVKIKVTGTSGNSKMFSQSNGESPLVIDELN